MWPLLFICLWVFGDTSDKMNLGEGSHLFLSEILPSMETEKNYNNIIQKLNRIINDEAVHEQCFVHKQLMHKTSDELEILHQALLQSKIKANESEDLKTTFLKNISHEIRTPLNAIVGFSNILQDNKTSDQQKKQKYAEIIQKNSLKLLNTVNSLIEYSLLTTTKIKVNSSYSAPNQILEILKSEFSEYQQSTALELLFFKNQQEKYLIKTDKTILKKTLNLLIDNALKFTEKGHVKISVKDTAKHTVFIVKDTGIGMDKNKQEMIYKSFMQIDNSLASTNSGLGLGLSIVKENAKLIKAEISIKSKPGEGTNFYLLVPNKKIKLINSKPMKYKILIAEDEEINFLYLEALLMPISDKTEVLHAANGEEAVEMIKNNNIDLVLLDIRMPVMDGYQAIKIIKYIKPNIPVIAQTAFVHDDTRIRESGFDDILKKPISPEQFFQTINKFIELGT